MHVLVRSTSDLRRLPSSVNPRNTHVHDGSLESLLNIFQASRPDVVVHLASLFIVHHQQSQVAELVQSNILFGALLLEAMSACTVRSFVNAGSFWQHYQGEAYNPANLYAATKQAFADILRYYVEAHGIRAVTLELPDTYGPNDPRRKIVNILIDGARSGKSVGLTKGEQILDLVHVDDVVEAIRAAVHLLASTEVANAVYSVSSGQPVKLKDLVALVGSIVGGHSSFSLGERSYRFREVMVPWEGGIPLPGWQARRRVEDFLKEELKSNR